MLTACLGALAGQLELEWVWARGPGCCALGHPDGMHGVGAGLGLKSCAQGATKLRQWEGAQVGDAPWGLCQGCLAGQLELEWVWGYLVGMAGAEAGMGGICFGDMAGAGGWWKAKASLTALACG